MSEFNFESVDFNVEEAQASAGGGMARPGTKALFSVEKVVFGESSNKKTPQLEVHFTSDKGGFRETFYITAAAMSRIKHLFIQFHKKDFTGTLSKEAFVSAAEQLVGKSAWMILTGKVTDEGKAYPALPYGGFASQNEDELTLSPKDEALAIKAGEVFDNYKAEKKEEAIADATSSDDNPF